MTRFIRFSTSVLCVLALLVCLSGGAALAVLDLGMVTEGVEFFSPIEFSSRLNSVQLASASFTAVNDSVSQRMAASKTGAMTLRLSGTSRSAAEEKYGTLGKVVEVRVDGRNTVWAAQDGDTTYISLNDFSAATGLDLVVDCDLTTGEVTVQGEGVTITGARDARCMRANGRSFYLPEGIRLRMGEVILPLRELALCFGLQVAWNDGENCVELDTTDMTPLASGSEVYDSQTLYWLARVINSEAGNQTLEGQIGVGNVVLNRVNSAAFPDNVYDVIFDCNFGVQFSVISDGSIYNEPDEDALDAARICLEGYLLVEDSLYFVNPSWGSTEWFSASCRYVMTIGDHDFYA